MFRLVTCYCSWSFLDLLLVNGSTEGTLFNATLVIKEGQVLTGVSLYNYHD